MHKITFIGIASLLQVCFIIILKIPSPLSLMVMYWEFGDYHIIVASFFSFILIVYIASSLVGEFLALVFTRAKGLVKNQRDAMIDGLEGIRPAQDIVKRNGVKLSRPKSLKMNAYVYGGFHSRIAINPAMAIGLVKGDDDAKSIFSHELAHVYMFDRLHFSLIFVLGLSLAVFPLLLSIGEASLSEMPLYLIFNVVLFIWLIRSREYIADTIGAYIMGDKHRYIAFLDSVGKGGGIFHPPTIDRSINLRKDNPLIKPSIPYAMFFVLSLFNAIQFRSSDAFDLDKSNGMIVIVILGFIVQGIIVSLGGSLFEDRSGKVE